MAKAYNYSTDATITIENVINKRDYVACDAGTPFIKVQRKYSEIKDKPGVKFDYLFNEDGTFMKAGENDFYVAVYEKYKTLSRIVPAYRAANSKISLEPGDKMTFTTNKKDEIVFYEKFAKAFAGELKVTINNKVVGKDYGDE